MKAEEVFRNPIQIGMVTDDLEKTLGYFQEILGIGPFTVVDFPPEGVEDVRMHYYGKQEPFTAKFCFFNLGNIEFEVIQPISGKTIWHDWLEKHGGPGLQHIKFLLPEHDPVREYMASKGIQISQSGSSVGKNFGKVWEYFDLDDKLGFSIETMNEII